MRPMTITEALVELKLLDKRITKADMTDWCIVQMKQIIRWDTAERFVHGCHNCHFQKRGKE